MKPVLHSIALPLPLSLLSCAAAAAQAQQAVNGRGTLTAFDAQAKLTAARVQVSPNGVKPTQ